MDDVAAFYDSFAESCHLVYGDDRDGAVERARREAERLGATVQVAVAHFRNLDAVGGDFDVVLSYDNAIPHLLDGAEIGCTLASMRRRLRPGGLPLVEGPPRQLVARLHDRDAPGEPLHSGEGWTLDHHHVRYRALTWAAWAARPRRPASARSRGRCRRRAGSGSR